MAKGKKASKVAKKRPRRRQARPTGVHPYQQLLADPCSSSVFSPYGGEAGFVQRFVFDGTMNTTAGHTAGFIQYTPASNVVRQFSNTGSGVVTAQASSTGPGGVYLGANAAKVRCVAACLTIIPSATTYNTMSGEIGAYVASDSTVFPGSSYSADQILTLTSVRSVMQKKEYEVKWFPGMLDHTYNTSNAGSGQFNVSDIGDVNAIGFVYRGYPSGIALNYRVTVVYEWTPGTNLGIATTVAPRAGIDHHALASSLHAAHPTWWQSVTHSLMQDLGKAGQYLGRKAISYGVGAIENASVRALGNAMPMLLM